jgi:hypothetical protein
MQQQQQQQMAQVDRVRGLWGMQKLGMGRDCSDFFGTIFDVPSGYD